MIPCQKCGLKNLADANYCDGCSHPLDQTCAACGGSNRPAARFCRHCQTLLGPTPAAPAVVPAAWPVVVPAAAAAEPRFELRPPTAPAEPPAPPARPTTRVVVHAPPPDAAPDAAPPADVAPATPPPAEPPPAPPTDVAPATPPPAEPPPARYEGLAHHRAVLRDYAGFWFDAEDRDRVGMSAEEAGYHLCLHAGMIHRYTGDAAVLAGLEELPPADRTELASAAARYAESLTLVRAAEPLLADDAVEPEALGHLADLLVARDDAEEALRVARRLVTAGGGESNAVAGLARADAALAELDELVWTREDVLAALAPVFAGLRAGLVVPPDPARQWWFTELDKIERRLDALNLDALIRVALPARNTPSGQQTRRAFAPADREPQAVLGAQTGGTVRDYPLKSADDAGVSGVVLVHPNNRFQFQFESPFTHGLTDAWDTGWVAAEVGGREVDRKPVARGQAVLTPPSPPDRFVLISPDGRRLRLDVG